MNLNILIPYSAFGRQKFLDNNLRLKLRRESKELRPNLDNVSHSNILVKTFLAHFPKKMENSPLLVIIDQTE